MSELKKVATRAGFGEEILKLGKENPGYSCNRCRYRKEL